MEEISEPPTQAWVNGAPASYEAAVSEAARLLRAATAPVFAHLGADVEGVREAVLLAEGIGGVLDHAASGALLADLDAIRETGAMLTTPLEAATRADVVLLIGGSLPESCPDTGWRWFDRPARPHGGDAARRTIWLRGLAGDVVEVPGAELVEAGADAELLKFLAKLRACAKRRRIEPSASVQALADVLRNAKFGVASWSASDLDPLAIEAIHGLVRDLNETTRFSTLAMAAPDNGLGVQIVCGWMTGFPLRTGFSHGYPEHDPWRFDSRRLLASGETDCIIWVSSLDGGASPCEGVAIAICDAHVRFPTVPRVRLDVGRPGVDHGAVLYDPRVGGLVACSATAPAAPSVAATLAAIRAQIDFPPC